LSCIDINVSKQYKITFINECGEEKNISQLKKKQFLSQKEKKIITLRIAQNIHYRI
jgi:hypothetical protein